MWVLIIYVILSLIGGAASLAIGAFVSSAWSDPISLPIFLFCYFGSLWLAWVIAVRIADSYQLEK